MGGYQLNFKVNPTIDVLNYSGNCNVNSKVDCTNNTKDFNEPIDLSIKAPKQPKEILNLNPSQNFEEEFIFSETPEQHLKHIQIVLKRLKEANLKNEEKQM